MKYFALVYIMVCLYSCHGQNFEKTGLEGKLLPSFKLLLPDSTTVFNIAEDATNKPIVLFYFGPNCPYSKAQMIEIVKNMDKLSNIQFYVFTSWPFDEMKSFYQQYKLYKFPNIIVGTDYANFFTYYFKVQGVPYMAIYGKDKRLNRAFIGKVSSKQINSISME